MSAGLRQKLFDELERKASKKLTTYSKLRNVGAVFDEGTTIIGKDNFMNEISNWTKRTISNVRYNLTAEEAFEADMYDIDWSDRGKEILKQMQKLSDDRKEKWIFHQPEGLQKIGWSTDKIVFHYKRNPRSNYKGRNLEGLFNQKLKQIVKKVINNSKIKIDYSHGKSLPKDFKSQNADLSDNFHGAAGTLSHRKIEGALRDVFKAYKGPKNDMFVSVARLFEAKFEDMFDTQLVLEGNRTKKQDASTLRYRGQLVFTKDKKNPSAPDKEVLDHFKAFIGQGDPEAAMNDAFADEVMKLCKVDLDKAQQLWSASPGPLDRANIMKQALAAEGLLTVKGKLDKRSKRVGKGGGLDMRMKVNKEFMKKMNSLKNSKGSTKGIKAKKIKSTSSTSGSLGAISRKKERVRTRDAAKTAQSPLHLEAMLQNLLPQEVAKRMGQGGALVYRSGRFANSVEPTQVMVGPRGGVQVDYTYDKFPYQTFEPGYKQGSTQRDPRKIIGESVRAIAQSIIGDKFLKVRRV